MPPNESPAPLLPCPCCGKPDLERWPCAWLDASGENVVRCAWCHCAAPMSAWNRRASTAPVASESRGSVPVGYIVHRAMGDPYFEPYAAVYGLPFGEHDLYAAPTTPPVASGESPDWAIAQAMPLWKERNGWYAGFKLEAVCEVEAIARELARSAAAKGEG